MKRTLFSLALLAFLPAIANAAITMQLTPTPHGLGGDDGWGDDTHFVFDLESVGTRVSGFFAPRSRSSARSSIATV